MTKRKATPAAWKPGQSGNPAGRTPGVEKIRQLLEPKREELVAKAVEMALGGDSIALRICIDRLAPPPKAESAPVKIPGLADALTPKEKADSIVAAVAEGQISFEAGERAMRLLGLYLQAITVTDHEARLRAIEEGKVIEHAAE